MAERGQTGRIECVYLTCFRDEFAFTPSILRYSGIRMHRAESIEEADFLLTVTGGTVFLCDAAFPEGTWREALETIAAVHPMAAALVVADPVERPYLADAEACGLVWKPWRFVETIELIQAADQAAHDRAAWAVEGARSQKPAAASEEPEVRRR